MTRASRTRPTAAAAVALLVTCLAQVLLAAPGRAAPAPSGHGWRDLTVVRRAPAWLSGASGESVPGGQFGAWRGRPVELATTWSDNDQDMVHFWQLQPGGDYAHWESNLDVAVGAFGAGESWSAAATGAYDARWEASLSTLARLRAGHGGTTYIRFAHEMNGSWYPWKVTASDRVAFVASWKRFRALQQRLFPAAQLVFSVNRESVGSGFDWRRSFPGRAYVDVLSVDYYNQYPFVATRQQWDATMQQTDQWGAPKGLQAHADFAARAGVPLALSEWGSNGSMGDSSEFMTDMHAWMVAHAGREPGHLLYESYFDVESYTQFALYTKTEQPQAAAAYRRLW